MKILYLSHLYHWIQRDPLLDFLERKYPHLKDPSLSPDYDLDRLLKSSFVKKEWLPSECVADTKWSTKVWMSSSMQLNSDEPADYYSNITLQTSGLQASVDRLFTPNGMKRMISVYDRKRECQLQPNEYGIVISSLHKPSFYILMKVQFGIFALQQLLNMSVSCFWLRIHNETKSTLSRLSMEKYVHEMKEGLEWLRDLDENLDDWSIHASRAPDPRLLPNLTNKNDEWQTLKQSLAERWGEVTSICHIGIVTRYTLHQKGIYSFYDLSFKEWMDHSDIDPVSRLIYESIIQNRSKELQALPQLSFDRTVVSVDIESYEGKWHDQTNAGDTFIGCLVMKPNKAPEMYYFFHMSHTTVKEQFALFLRTLCHPLLIHYTEADLSVFPERGYQTVDVHQLLRTRYEEDGYYRQFGWMRFGLKHICGKLFGNLYAGCKIQNGKQASAALYHSIRYGLETLKGKQLFQEVCEYNKIDVYALAYLYKWIIEYENRATLQTKTNS